MNNHEKANPIARLERLWKIGERVAVFSAMLVVTGTIGYISLHILA